MWPPCAQAGPLDAASNAETSLTQLVQQFTVRAQARELRRATGARLDRTERVANALGHLAGVITRLQALRGSGMKVTLCYTASSAWLSLSLALST
jgi:hypothetical protein